MKTQQSKRITSKIFEKSDKKINKTNRESLLSDDRRSKSRLKSLKMKFLKFIHKNLLKMKDVFLFTPTLNLLQFILEKNNKQIRFFQIYVIEYILGESENYIKYSCISKKFKKKFA